MKKTIKMFFAAAFAIVSAACAREEIFESEMTRGESRTFTCAIDEDAQTRTEITKQGKTVWKEGDRILVSNGTESDTLTVDSKFAGQKYFEFTTTLQGKIYVVYPYNSVKEIKDGKFTLEIPEVQNGEFGSANIACAIAEDRYVKMKNVTAVLKFRVPKEVITPVTSVVINSVDNNVAGQFNVDLTSGTPVVETPAENTYTSSVTVKTDGNNGNNFYATVIPGTYKAGFTMSAVTLDINKAIENKTTVSDKELKVNAYYDLGNIGANLQPLGGDGSAAKPYLINNYAEFLMFTSYVNSGKTMRGQSVKLMNDIKGVKTSVGSIKFDNRGRVLGPNDTEGVGTEIILGNIPFQGEFDGNGKTVTVNMNNTSAIASGLFANVADSAYIHDVTIAGNVTSTYKHASGLAGFVRTHANYTGKVLIRIANCKNTAKVTGSNYVGGIAGWVDTKAASSNVAAILIDNCSNEAEVSGTSNQVGGLISQMSYCTLRKCTNTMKVSGTLNVGGLVGYAYLGEIYDGSNTGAITATKSAGPFLNGKGGGQTNAGGAGGLTGYAQNIVFKRCTNNGAVKGVNKCGGISGTLYWGSIISSRNDGSVSVNEDAAGGIVGWNYAQAVIYDCHNKGEITTKRYQAGGIVGQTQSWHPKNAASIKYERCVNEGKILVTDGNAAGGIIGYAWVMNNVARVDIFACQNKGEVTGPQYVGGILGCVGRYSNWSRVNIQNCENHGDVLGTKINDKSADVNVVAGGIFGGPLNYILSQGVMIENCFNDGNIAYSVADNKVPNVGGIAGVINQGANGLVRNCYNSGRIGPKDGSAPVENAQLGAIIGYNAAAGNVDNLFYLDSACNRMTAPNSKGFTTSQCVSAVDKDGNILNPVTIKGTTYSNVVEALNAWRSGNLSYYSWTTGPKFVYPSYTDFGSGDYDLGNGGQI